ncbi:hypothetical protein MHBO_001773 [Bonamia ostreae]|uniref:Uncharacterized protein n=1 Tax=Bonamia ostreae TaxID=126728 RepID=A0ABV2AL77_9EUKA
MKKAFYNLKNKIKNKKSQNSISQNSSSSRKVKQKEISTSNSIKQQNQQNQQNEKMDNKTEKLQNQQNAKIEKIEKMDKTKQIQKLKDEPKNENTKKSSKQNRHKNFQNRIEKMKRKNYSQMDILNSNFTPFCQNVPREKEFFFVKMCRLVAVPFSFSKHSPPFYVQARRTKGSVLHEIELIAAAPLGWLTASAAEAFEQTLTQNLFLPGNAISPPSGDAAFGGFFSPDWEHRLKLYGALRLFLKNESADRKLVDLICSERVTEFLFKQLVFAQDERERNAANRALWQIFDRSPAKKKSEIVAKTFDFLEEAISAFSVKSKLGANAKTNSGRIPTARCDSGEPIPGIGALFDFLSQLVPTWKKPLALDKRRCFRNLVLPLVELRTREMMMESPRGVIYSFLESCFDLVVDAFAAAVRWKLDDAIFGFKVISLSLRSFRSLKRRTDLDLKAVDDKLALAVVGKIAEGAVDSNFRVADMAISLLSDDIMLPLLFRNEERGLHLLLNKLYQNQSHWCVAIRMESEKTIEAFAKTDSEVLGPMTSKFENNQVEKLVDKRRKEWQLLERKRIDL